MDLLSRLWPFSVQKPSLVQPHVEHARRLEYERAIAHRTGVPFAVASFTAEKKIRYETEVQLVNILKSRLRHTDSAGRSRDGSISIVMPGTTRVGAERFLDDIRTEWPDSLPWPNVEVRVYPAEPQTARSANLARSMVVSSASMRNQVVPQETTASDEPHVETMFAKRLPLWKRALDMAVAAIGLLALSPLCFAIALLIKCSSPGPVIFRQRRTGLGGRPFWLYKFRSMVADAEALKKELIGKNEQDGPAFKIEEDPRVTQIGALLRATSLDELPQLWNVLKGDMSLVGPRPLPCDEANGCENWQRRRLDVTPGITCIWQVKERRTKIAFADWIRMDLQYVRSRSPKLDIKLIYQTVKFMLRRGGV